MPKLLTVRNHDFLKTNEKLLSVINKYEGCQECSLHETANAYVFFRGVSPCDVLFLGEAPGSDENLAGLPFIGRAGALLDEWIRDAYAELGHAVRSDQIRLPQIQKKAPFTFGITNVVCCRPIDDNNKIRPPSQDEVDACKDRLLATLKAAKPKTLILLGKSAVEKSEGLLFADSLELQHPAYVLRQGGKNSEAYTRNVMELIDHLTERFGNR